LSSWLENPKREPLFGPLHLEELRAVSKSLLSSGKLLRGLRLRVYVISASFPPAKYAFIEQALEESAQDNLFYLEDLGWQALTSQDSSVESSNQSSIPSSGN